MMPGPVKVITATVLPSTSEGVTFRSTEPPPCLETSKAPGSKIMRLSKVTVRLVTIERCAELSLMTILWTRGGGTNWSKASCRAWSIAAFTGSGSETVSKSRQCGGRRHGEIVNGLGPEPSRDDVLVRARPPRDTRLKSRFLLGGQSRQHVGDERFSGIIPGLRINLTLDGGPKLRFIDCRCDLANRIGRRPDLGAGPVQMQLAVDAPLGVGGRQVGKSHRPLGSVPR